MSTVTKQQVGAFFSGETVYLSPSDSKIPVKVPIEVAAMSNTIKNMIEDLGQSDVPIPLHNVNSNILGKVITFCEHYLENPESNTQSNNPSENKSYEFTSWEKNYFDIDQAVLFEVILAANYLDIKSLLDKSCKTVAQLIEGKTPEEIRKAFNIKNDFTPEEEEKVRKENEWTEEK